MSLKELFCNLPLKSRLQRITGKRCFFWKSGEDILETAEEKPIFAEEEKQVDVGIEEKRNKSRLHREHRNMLHGLNPYDEPDTWYQHRVRYKKRVLGRYGLQALGVPAGLAWPTREEVEEMKKYEKIAFPLTIQERLSKIKEEKRQKEEYIMARQQEIDRKMATMDKMISDVQEKVAKKEAAQLEAQMKKDRKIEEVRRKLIAEGYLSAAKIEKELSELEKAEKKKKKEAKKAKMLEKQEKWAKKLQEQANAESRQTKVEEEDTKQD